MKFVPACAWLIGVGLVGMVAAEEEAPKEEVVNEGPNLQAETGARKNITLGAMFREEFKQQEGVQELKCGVMYKVEGMWTAGFLINQRRESRRDCGWIGLFLDGRRFCRG
ncbi:MAG: hypothetical protein EBW82_01680 [Verrucomicrobia bacterium]|nr:hypothetical protein [Verrucomicrobiota bacterium]